MTASLVPSGSTVLIGRNGSPSHLASSWRRRVGVVVACALVATLGVLADPARAHAALPPAAKAKANKVSSRPDLVSAQVTARAQGSRVEVESLRGESSTTWVNPDGTLTTQQHLGPIRFKDAKGAWRDVDLAMAAWPDGTAGPKGRACTC